MRTFSFALVALLLVSTAIGAEVEKAEEKPGPQTVVCCGKHETSAGCSNFCSEPRCETRLKPIYCRQLCRPGYCHCKKHYYRNKCGVCVKARYCDKPCEQPGPIQCPGLNEQLVGCYDPTTARTCANRHKKKKNSSDDSSSSAESLPYPNSAEQFGLCTLNVCDCILGYLRNKCGVCVRSRHCNRPCERRKRVPCSDPNEIRVREYRECKARNCKKVECNKKTRKVQWYKCDCKPKYKRNACGQCVPEEECFSKTPCKCTNPCQGKHEEWRCFNPCYERTCANSKRRAKCKPDCSYKCDCVEGYWRYNGICVLEKDCPPDSEEHTT